MRVRDASDAPPARSGVTARTIVGLLPPGVLSIVEDPAPRAVSQVELGESGRDMVHGEGDLVVGVGQRRLEEVLGLVHRARSAGGLVLRSRWAGEEAVRNACRDHQLPLLAAADDTPWAGVLGRLCSALEQMAGDVRGDVRDGVQADLFDLADRLGIALDAPVTIEDATSRVLAYSTGQRMVDEARQVTIMGRQVPRQVRDRFRSLGVFRRLASSNAPIFIPSDGQGVKARLVVPIRVGGEWLGSIWAVVDDPGPADLTEKLGTELRATIELIGVLMLRLRGQRELRRQMELDRLADVLRDPGCDRPVELGVAPWRVAALNGPGRRLPGGSRRELWCTLLARRGWRDPLVADLGDSVFVVLRSDGSGPGSARWLSDLVDEEWRQDPSVNLVLGRAVSRRDELAQARAEVDELRQLELAGKTPVVAVEEEWAQLVLARALATVRRHRCLSPTAALVRADGGTGGKLAHTLEVVLDHWGAPQRAAEALGIHPNTVRYRMDQIRQLCAVDLTDPTQRLALKLELAALSLDG